jgi:hypothetical protein
MNKLIKSYFNSIKCKFKGHKLLDAGSCPYTGLSYKFCTICGGVIGQKPIA